MRTRLVMAMAGAVVGAAALGGCATGPTRFPVEATRFHYDPVADRGTFTIQPADGAGPGMAGGMGMTGGMAPGMAGPVAGTPGPEFQTYAGFVAAEMQRLGFTPAAPGAAPQFRVFLSVSQATRPLAPRRSPVSIGLGAGGFSGGGYRGGGVGLGGGVSFPVGGGRGRIGVATQLGVQLRRGPDAVWEGQARVLSDASAPDANANGTAARLAHAMFLNFPGESGRTVEVR